MDSVNPGIAIRAVVTEVVVETAEDELFLVHALEEVDDDEVVRRLTRQGKSRDPLGFGVEAASAVVTSIVWIALSETVRKLVDTAAERIGEAKRRRRRKSAPVVVPPLTREQLAEVETAIITASRTAGLSEKRAGAIAHATVSRLILAPAEAGGNTVS